MYMQSGQKVNLSGTALIRYQRLRQDSLGRFFCLAGDALRDKKTLREDAHSHEGEKVLGDRAWR